MTLRNNTLRFLGNDGQLASLLDGWEERPQQSDMAGAVADAIEDRGSLVVEAATGTGKTLAYLVPALLSRKRTIVSTATRTLQDQLFEKDIPLLKNVIPHPIRATLLKGRQNYLCWWQFENFRKEPKFRRPDDVGWWAGIESWSETTDTGDRAELRDLPDEYATWADLSIGADSCLGRECAHYDRCFVVRARQRAADSDLIVVNHHLFFADMSLRRSERVELLPDADTIVFDEAHHLEEVAANWFGTQLSNYRVLELLRDVLAFLGRENALSDTLRYAVEHAREATRVLFGLLARAVPGDDGRVELSAALDGPDAPVIITHTGELELALQGLADQLQANGRGGEVTTRLVDRCRTIQSELSLLLHRESNELVYLLERRGAGVFLQAVPIDISRVLRSLLHGDGRARIYTSATLTTDGDFRFFRQRLGLPEATRELRLEPVFDYTAQASLYIPRDVPEPSDPRYIDKVAPLMLKLVKMTEGRAFLLFTSYRNMRRAWELMADRIPHQVLMQGERSRAALLEEFRRDVHSVLFATSSFWEGVDVQGEALSLVVIDKLPFASPSDPLVAARVRNIEERGGNGFSEYQVPAAAIALKQGVGRLIRHRDDYGIIAILDSRLTTKPYGRRFLKSLPPLRRSSDLDDLAGWWEVVVNRPPLH